MARGPGGRPWLRSRSSRAARLVVPEQQLTHELGGGFLSLMHSCQCLGEGREELSAHVLLEILLFHRERLPSFQRERERDGQAPGVARAASFLAWKGLESSWCV